MNQSQLKYVRTRVEAIYGKRKEAIRKAATTPARTLTTAEKVAALREGNFTVLDAHNQSGSPFSLSSFVDFGETREKVDDKRVKEETAALDAAYRSLLDELVLGDSTEALALIAKFEKE